MYKVFFNQKPLILTNEIQDFSDNEPLLYIKYTSVPQIIKALKSSKNRKVFLYHKDIDKLWKSFKKKFPVVEAAGGLVERTDKKILFIFRNNKWDLPKGGIEKNELIIEAAQREVTEETGVSDLIVQKQLSETFHIFKKGKRFRLKKTYWFKMSTSYTGKTKPQTEEGIKKTEWVSKEKIDDILNNAFENIRIIVLQVLKSDTLWNE